MANPILRVAGGHLAHKAMAKHTTGGGPLDVRFGLSLLRDRRVPVGAKALSLLVGVGLAAALVVLELPIETIVAAVLPLLGLVVDFAFDGLETIIVSVVLAALLVPALSPKALVRQIRAERTGLQPIGS